MQIQNARAVIVGRCGAQLEHVARQAGRHQRQPVSGGGDHFGAQRAPKRMHGKFEEPLRRGPGKHRGTDPKAGAAEQLYGYPGAHANMQLTHTG